MRQTKRKGPSRVLGLPLPHDETAEFCVLAGGIVFFYVVYGYLQEYMNSITKAHDVHMSWFLTCIQFFTYAFFSFILSFPPRLPPKNILIAFAKVGACSVATIGFSNNATEYLNYPTAVIFKCNKLLIVIAVGQFLFKKNYKVVDYFAAFNLTLGLAFFSLGDYTVLPNFNPTGMLLMLGSLTADAFIGNIQEELLGFTKGKNSSKGMEFSVPEQLFYTKFIGGCILLIISMLNGNFSNAMQFANADSIPFFLLVIGFGIVGMIGENFILTLMAKHGVVVLLTTTTVRKVFTILLSFWFFTKPFTYIYLIGGVFTMYGILLSIYRKSPKTFAKAKNLVRRYRRKVIRRVGVKPTHERMLEV